MTAALNGLALCSAAWALRAMGSAEHMAPDNLQAVLKQPLSANESLASLAADMCSLALLLKNLPSNHIPLASTKQRSCTLSPETADKGARGFAEQHRQRQVCLATLQRCMCFFNTASA